MRANWTLLFLFIALLLTAAGALSVVFFLSPSRPAAAPLPQPAPKSAPAAHPPTAHQALWRVPVSTTANPPTPLPCGWLVTEGNGHIRSLTDMGEIRWQASYTNYAWQASSVVDDKTLCAVTQKGQLVLFDAESGDIKWSTETHASCLHPPVVALIDRQRVILLLSQDDGALTCINAQDGSHRWKSPPTSRSDGPLARFGDLLAYGNCDAAVHLFSIRDGQLTGAIQLEDDEQVAGGILPLPDGKIVLGTRKGTLVMLDPARTQCVARVSLSDAEAFATPVLVAPDRIMMPVSDGRLTFWRIAGDQLLAEEVIRLSASLAETVALDTVFWAIANRTVYAVRLNNPSEQMQFKPGDDLRAIAPGCRGKTALIADSDLICVKGF